MLIQKKVWPLAISRSANNLIRDMVQSYSENYLTTIGYTHQKRITLWSDSIDLILWISRAMTVRRSPLRTAEPRAPYSSVPHRPETIATSLPESRVRRSNPVRPAGSLSIKKSLAGR